MHDIVTIIAKYLIVASVVLSLAVWYGLPKSSKKSFILLGLGSAVVALILAYIGRKLYYDPRPFVAGNFVPYFSHAADNGFPSDHTLLASLLGYVVLLFHRKSGVWLLAFAVIIGLSRVVAGVHHLADIAGSFAITFISVWLVAQLYLRLKPDSAPLRKR